MLDPTVFIIDDDPVIGQAISWLLTSVGINTKIFSDAQSYLNAHDPALRGCLLIDVRMPGMSGLELQQKLKEKSNCLPIIMISGHGDVPMAVRAMQEGAIDFILKPFNDQMLLEKIQAAIRHSQQQPFVSNSMVEKSLLKNLTPRERQVMELVIKGKMNKQIAADLAISMSTVEVHRAKIMQKMQVKTLADLIKGTLPLL